MLKTCSNKQFRERKCLKKKVIDVINLTNVGKSSDLKTCAYWQCKANQSFWSLLFWDSYCHFCVQYAPDSRWTVSGRPHSITLLLCPSLRHVCPWLNFPFLLMICSETDPWQEKVTWQCSRTRGLRHLQLVVMAAVWNVRSDRSGECSLDTGLNQLWRVWRFVVYVIRVVCFSVGQFSLFYLLHSIFFFFTTSFKTIKVFRYLDT